MRVSAARSFRLASMCAAGALASASLIGLTAGPGHALPASSTVPFSCYYFGTDTLVGTSDYSETVTIKDASGAAFLETTPVGGGASMLTATQGVTVEITQHSTTTDAFVPSAMPKPAGYHLQGTGAAVVKVFYPGGGGSGGQVPLHINGDANGVLITLDQSVLVSSNTVGVYSVNVDFMWLDYTVYDANGTPIADSNSSSGDTVLHANCARSSTPPPPWQWAVAYSDSAVVLAADFSTSAQCGASVTVDLDTQFGAYPGGSTYRAGTTQGGTLTINGSSATFTPDGTMPPGQVATQQIWVQSDGRERPVSMAVSLVGGETSYTNPGKHLGETKGKSSGNHNGKYKTATSGGC